MFNSVAFILALASTTLAFPHRSRLVDNKPKYVKSVPVPNVAFANILNVSSTPRLFLSTFSGNPIINKDGVYYSPDVQRFVSEDEEIVNKIEGKVTWPNTVAKAPASVFGDEGIVTAGGFLVPGKSDGGIWFSFSGSDDQEAWWNLYTAKHYFYHQVTFYDVDKDGELDILTCRATKPMFGGGKGNLTYLVPKDREDPTGPWVETILNAHCDTFFVIADINNDGKDEIIATEFWGDRISVIETSDPSGSFADPSYLSVSTVDESAGHMIGIEVTDVNNDGKLDLVVTNHQGGKETPEGAIFVYEAPNKQGDKWNKHVLAKKFEVLQKGFKQAAPGLAVVFQPHSNSRTKPVIALSGDGSQKVYLLNAVSQSPSNWEYEMTVLHDCKATAGGLAVADVMGTGSAQIFIPCYDTGLLVVYSY